MLGCREPARHGAIEMYYFCLVETDLCRPHLEWLPGRTLYAARQFEQNLPDQHRKPAATYIYADDERLDISDL